MPVQENEIQRIAQTFPPDVVSMNPDAFDTVTANTGVLLKHYANVPCAGGDTDPGDVRSAGHVGCKCGGTGRDYRFAGNFTGIFTNVSKNQRYQVDGMVDYSQANIIVPRFYQDTDKRIYFAPYDLIEPCCEDESEILVVYWERVSISAEGIDRLDFPAVKVILLIDAYGNEYHEGTDFVIWNGAIKWVGQNRPGVNQMLDEGVCYSVRYLIKGGWIINSLVHEIRTLKVASPSTGEVKTVRFPMFINVIKQIDFWGGKLGKKNKVIDRLLDHYIPDDITLTT